ncbi:diacylglycerol/lipid kinase family protein [Bacillus sp. SCS-153A]|uniref:diacylglycerol/lipid kinase family protein n=1 Tax=Rossellomorea sedimentorum TaxID=3115294 RepID=UPI0039067424
MRTLYIVNINAKNSYSFEVWKKLKKQLKVHPDDVCCTTSAEEVKTIIQSAVEAAPYQKLLIVGVGGDGTISGIVNQCIGYENVTVGYFPAGSGNDFANGYGWPVKAGQAAKVIRMIQKERIKDIEFDTGYYMLNRCRKGYFVNSMGTGFDAKITERANNSVMKRWLNKLSMGKLIYAVLLLSEALTYKPGFFEVVIDGEKKKFNDTWFITVSNQPFYGGGMKISPAADPSDGLLDLTIVHSLSRWKLLMVFLFVFIGKHTLFKEVETYKVKEVHITSKTPVPVQADGDYIGRICKDNNLHIEVQHQNWKTAELS